MASSAEQKCARLNSGHEEWLFSEEGNAVRFKTECYLRAWRFEDHLVEEFTAGIMETVWHRFHDEPDLDPVRIAIEEADKRVTGWLKENSITALQNSDELPSSEQRVALLFSQLPETGQLSSIDPAELAAAYHQGLKNFQISQQPQRPLETYHDTVRTSLSRLPSFRLIAGWCLFIILLVVAFALTH